MNLVEFGKYLAWMRNTMEMTQHQLAERVNCAWYTISRIENGHELPRKKLFMEFNRAFEAFGIIYDELELDEIFQFRKARKELLMAIKNGRVEEIEKKLESFCRYMEEDNEEDKEDRQYFVLAYLIMSRKAGMTIEQFLDEIVKVFEIRRDLPKYEDIQKVRLTQIEYEILFMIGEIHIVQGNTEEGEQILKGLMANKLDERSPFIKDKYAEISAILAKACLHKKDYETMQQCLEYVFNEYINSNDTRRLLKSLALHGELCKNLGDEKGARLVDEFMQATQNLMYHICGEYTITKYL